MHADNALDSALPDPEQARPADAPPPPWRSVADAARAFLAHAHVQPERKITEPEESGQ